MGTHAVGRYYSTFGFLPSFCYFVLSVPSVCCFVHSSAKVVQTQLCFVGTCHCQQDLSFGREIGTIWRRCNRHFKPTSRYCSVIMKKGWFMLCEPMYSCLRGGYYVCCVNQYSKKIIDVSVSSMLCIVAWSVEL